LRDSPPRFFEERARERPVTALRKKAVRCSCAAVEAPKRGPERSPSGPNPLARAKTRSTVRRALELHLAPLPPSILRLSIAFAACVSACSASTPLVAHPGPARPLRKPLNCLTSRSRAAPPYSRRPTLSLTGRTRARPSSSSRLPRWTSSGVSSDDRLTLASVSDCGSAAVVVRHDRWSSAARACRAPVVTAARRREAEVWPGLPLVVLACSAADVA
jgi:hypothetical protein